MKKIITAIVTALITTTTALSANAQDCAGGFHQAITHDEFKACIDKGEDITDASMRDVITNKKIPISVMDLLIKAGLDVNSRFIIFIPAGQAGWEVNRNTPLHWAAIRSDKNELITTLIDAGASVHLRNVIGWTPLSLAVNHNNLEGVKLLLDAGADIHTLGIDGTRPIHLAALATQPSIEMIKLLISKGADLTHRATTGKTALDIYADRFTKKPTELYRTLKP